MITPHQVALAAALAHARRTGVPLCAADWADPPLSPDEADAVQAQVSALLGWSALGLPGAWKSGGPARQGPFSHAPIAPDGLQRMPSAPLLGIEAEVALRLGCDVDAALAASLQPGDLPAGLVDAMAPAIELLGSRWLEGLAAPEWLRRADHQTNAGLMIGPWTPFEPRDWARQRLTVQVGQAQARQLLGGHSLDDPSWLLPAWLRHLCQQAAVVPAGTIVTTGAWCGCVPVQSGERVVVLFDGLGQVSADLATPTNAAEQPV